MIRPTRSSVRLAAPVTAILVLLSIWELTTRAFNIRAIALPRPSDVLSAIADNPGLFLSTTWVTLAEAGLGLVIGFLAAGAAASVMAHSRVVERLSWPAIIILQST
ncbi:MAG: hypothetical protein OER95_17900, partial [Acidimicrobiia bacterium]|nr:hypothetical protein [Acidimicrobiia bacterium]